LPICRVDRRCLVGLDGDRADHGEAHRGLVRGRIDAARCLRPVPARRRHRSRSRIPEVGWGLDEYVGLNREDKRYATSLGLVYKLSRTMQLKGELRQSWLRSNVAGSDYTATAILVGLRLQR